jgi:proteasome lid subunit RPN8/RPN11
MKQCVSQTEIPEDLFITAGALGKIKCYVRLAGDLECYGFLLTPQDAEDITVYDALLAPNQAVSGARAQLNPDGACLARKQIEERGYKAIGFWHSHAGMGVFHSSTDEDNLKGHLLAFAQNSEKRTTASNPYNLAIKDKIYFSKNGLEFRITLEKGNLWSQIMLTEDLELLINDNSHRITVKKPIQIEIGKCQSNLKIAGVAYSLVVNRHGDCFAKKAVNRWCSFCGKDETEMKETKLNIVQAEKDIAFKEEDLRKEVQEKLVCAGGWGRFFKW